MASKRMISLSVVDTDEFCDMPSTAQNLYFHFCVRADDDGFVSCPNKIMKSIGSSISDLDELLRNEFVLQVGKNIVVITHWHIHNTIQRDRYKHTIYADLLDLLVIRDKIYHYSDEFLQYISDLDKK